MFQNQGFLTLEHIEEPVAQAMETLRFIRKNKRHILRIGGGVGIHISPGTEVERFAKEEGLMPKGFHWSKPYHNKKNLAFSTPLSLPILIQPPCRARDIPSACRRLVARSADADRQHAQLLSGLRPGRSHRATVYVSTSRSDSTSVSLLEAMACAAVPVVSDIPANHEWIEDGVNGLFYPAGDTAALAAALSRLLGDETLRSRFAGRNLEIIRKHGLWEPNMAQVEAAFKKLITRA